MSDETLAWKAEHFGELVSASGCRLAWVGMAVDPADRQRDMYHARLREHDERVTHRDCVYYVRGVRLPGELKGSPGEHAAWYAHPILGAAVSLRRVGARRHGWLLGVVRIASVATRGDLAPQVVHEERLDHGADPMPRIVDVAEAAARGDFAT